MGNDGDVIRKVEVLERENKVLSQRLSTLEQAFDGFISKINETC